jgi:hypothetical protein
LKCSYKSEENVSGHQGWMEKLEITQNYSWLGLAKIVCLSTYLLIFILSWKIHCSRVSELNLKQFIQLLTNGSQLSTSFISEEHLEISGDILDYHNQRIDTNVIQKVESRMLWKHPVVNKYYPGQMLTVSKLQNPSLAFSHICNIHENYVNEDVVITLIELVHHQGK